ALTARLQSRPVPVGHDARLRRLEHAQPADDLPQRLSSAAARGGLRRLARPLAEGLSLATLNRPAAAPRFEGTEAIMAALNHIIIPAEDKDASAKFLAGILGVEPRPQWGPFRPVQTSNG